MATAFSMGPLGLDKQNKAFDYRFVGLFDFLGVKRMLRDGVSADKLVEWFRPVFDEARGPATYSDGNHPNMPLPHFFSDSILLWSKNAEDGVDFILQARKLMAYAILGGIPLSVQLRSYTVVRHLPRTGVQFFERLRGRGRHICEFHDHRTRLQAVGRRMYGTRWRRNREESRHRFPRFGASSASISSTVGKADLRRGGSARVSS